MFGKLQKDYDVVLPVVKHQHPYDQMDRVCADGCADGCY